MPRPAKPYLCRGWYVTNLGGKPQRLCPEADGLRAAKDALLHLQQEVQGNGWSGFSLPDGRGNFVALFLNSVKVERSHHTYLNYQRWLTEFAQGPRPPDRSGHQPPGCPAVSQRHRQRNVGPQPPVAPAVQAQDGQPRRHRSEALLELGDPERAVARQEPLRQDAPAARRGPAAGHDRRGVPGVAAALLGLLLPAGVDRPAIYLGQARRSPQADVGSGRLGKPPLGDPPAQEQPHGQGLKAEDHPDVPVRRVAPAVAPAPERASALRLPELEGRALDEGRLRPADGYTSATGQGSAPTRTASPWCCTTTGTRT